jgi:hypothetical protein
LGSSSIYKNVEVVLHLKNIEVFFDLQKIEVVFHFQKKLSSIFPLVGFWMGFKATKTTTHNGVKQNVGDSPSLRGVDFLGFKKKNNLPTMPKGSSHTLLSPSGNKGICSITCNRETNKNKMGFFDVKLQPLL